MKTKLFTLFLALVASVGTISSSVVINGIVYKLNNNQLTAEVISTPGTDVTYSGDIVIPSTVTYNSNEYSVTSIGSYAFYMSEITSIIIPNSVQSIEDAAFAKCANMASVTIGSGVQRIGVGSGMAAFAYCTNLSAVHICDIAAWCGMNFVDIEANNPLYYAHRLYLNDKEITNLVIPEGVTIIETYAFNNCLSITSLYLPNSVSTIGNSFVDCTNLKLIYSSSATPPTIGYHTFKNISSDAVVYVPDEYVATYKKAQYWKNMNIQGSSSMPQAIDQVSNNQSPMTNKVIKDGQIFILRGDKTYTLQGQEVK